MFSVRQKFIFHSSKFRARFYLQYGVRTPTRPRLRAVLTCLLLFALPSVLQAQGFGDVLADAVAPDWDEYMPDNYVLSPHDFSLMGDEIDPHTGQLTFSTVDVSLPGNSDLEVAIRRDLIPLRRRQGEFRNWHLALPSIQTMVNSNITGAWSGQRCSRSFASSLPIANYPSPTPASYKEPGKWSNGVKLVIPGEARQELLDNPVGSLFPSNARKVTSNGWYFTCIPNVVTSAGESEHQGEGFYGFAPDGRRYTFNRYVVRSNVSTTRTYSARTHIFGGSSSTSSVGSSSSVRIGATNQYYIIRATEVTDQHGNWVRYDYDSEGRVTAIYANDGRRIELEYATATRVGRVVANPGTSQERVWRYEYGLDRVNNSKTGEVQEDPVGVLREVVLPDGRSWEYHLGGLHVFAVQGGSSCSQEDQFVSVEHPDGTRAEYDITEVSFFNGRVSHSHSGRGPVCPGTTSAIGIGISFNMAVAEKRLIVPRSVTSTWKYEYNVDRGSLDSSKNKTQVVYPDGSMKRYFHVTATRSLGGTLDREELYASETDTTPIQTIDYEYNLATRFGSSVINRSYQSNTSEYRPLRTKMTLTRGEDEYVTEYGYNQSVTQSNSFGQPTSIERYSNTTAGKREETISYQHNVDNWIMAQPTRVTRNGKRFADYSYDSKGRVSQYDAFGVTQGSYSYETELEDALGTLQTFTDALGRKTHFENWYRGKPRKITEAYGTADARVTEIGVDANGWVTWHKNARGYTTNYEYDEAGRYTEIDLPSPNNDITIAYSRLGNGIEQTITQGDSRETTRYDGLLRPEWVRSQALDTGWSSYVNTIYDSSGRVAFTSFPSTSQTESNGVETEYDALGRVIEISENVAPYATTTMEYLSDNRTRTTDPEGYVTTTTYNGYGGPDDGGVIRIDQPEGVSTVINRDIYGLMTSVTQAGKTQNYYYNDELLLCRYRTPEGGDTLYAYDAARDMSSYAKGIASTSSSCATPSGVSRVTLTRDNLGRVVRTDYASSNTPDIYVEYDENDNVLWTRRGTQILINTYEDISRWTYTYDEMDRVLTENLDIDGRDYDMSYTYDGNGYMTEQVLPSSRIINYTRDGLGRERSLWSPDVATLADQFSYHTNGAVQSMDYGNGFEYSTTLNNRMLPETMLAQRGSTRALDFQYSYDARGDISYKRDGLFSFQSRTYTYDGLSRLTSAAGPQSYYGVSGYRYTYDALGNLLEKIYGLTRVTNSYDEHSGRLASTRKMVYGFGSAPTSRAVSYDSRGNVTTLGDQSFVYDFNDQPIELSGAVTGSYQYDGNLKRVKSEVNGKTIYNVYNLAGQLVHIDEVTDDNETDYVRAAGMTIARIENGTPTYLHSDHLGSASAGSRQNGSIAWRERYSPYGEKIASNSANDDQAGFTGHIHDSATGLTYMQARYYDPEIGRFLSIDPVGFGGSGYDPRYFNRYAYAGNNPIKYVDPSGGFFENGPGLSAQLEFFMDRLTPTERRQVVNGATGTAASGLSVSGTILSFTPFAPLGAFFLTSAGGLTAVSAATSEDPDREVPAEIAKFGISRLTGGMAGLAKGGELISNTQKVVSEAVINEIVDRAVDELMVNSATSTSGGINAGESSSNVGSSATNDGSGGSAVSPTSNRDRGMSGGNVRICTGTGAQKGGCR